MNFSELRVKAQEVLQRAKSDLEAAGDSQEALAAADAALAAAIEEADKLEARADQLEAIESRSVAFNKPVNALVREDRAAPAKVENAEVKAADAFRNYMRGAATGADTVLLREERMKAGVPAEGGFLVPTVMANAISSTMKQIGPMLDGSVSTLLKTSGGNPIGHPTCDETAEEGALIAESTDLGKDDIAFGSKTLGAYKYTSKIIPVSNELLADSAFDVEAFVSTAVANRIARIANKHFTTGTGSAQPEGIVTAAGVGVEAAAATAVTAAELVELTGEVDIAYHPNARYMFNQKTLTALMSLNGSDGRPLWQASLRDGSPATLNGFAYVINNAMPDIAAGARAIIFGDFSKHVVRQAGPLSVKRLTERYADLDQVGFVALARYDSKLIDTAAVKALVQKAS